MSRNEVKLVFWFMVAIVIFLCMVGCGGSGSNSVGIPTSTTAVITTTTTQPTATTTTQIPVTTTTSSPTTTTVPRVTTSTGDRATYKDVSTCPTLAQSAIQTKALPVSLIHSCDEESAITVEGESVSKITVYYGPGQSCPAGCVYTEYSGIFTNSNQQLVDLTYANYYPGAYMLWAFPKYAPLGVYYQDVYPPFGDLTALTQTGGWWWVGETSTGYQAISHRHGVYGRLYVFDYSRTIAHWKTLGVDAQQEKRLYSASGEIFVYYDPSHVMIIDLTKVTSSIKEIQ